MIDAIVQGARDAAGEVAGLVLLVALVWLASWVCRSWDRAVARRRRRAIAEARVLAAMPAWVTPGMVWVRDGEVIGYRWLGYCPPNPGDDIAQLRALESMMVRSRRAGVR
nr:hypothetical protein [Micromonospora sp. RTP1Z1]